jgi:hypothetical protein
MEQYLGRHLERYEIVHHINGDKQDDRIGNLRLISSAQHCELHHPMIDMSSRVCCECGRGANEVIGWRKRPDKGDDVFECGNCHKRRGRQ